MHGKTIHEYTPAADAVLPFTRTGTKKAFVRIREDSWINLYRKESIHVA
jgi:hypothetical protein